MNGPIRFSHSHLNGSKLFAPSSSSVKLTLPLLIKHTNAFIGVALRTIMDLRGGQGWPLEVGAILTLFLLPCLEVEGSAR